MRSLPALLATLAMPLLPAALPAQSCTQAAAPVALVLSGGGAKGIAHIGVLRVLDSLGVRPDIVVGTSMGAVIGGMYASGYAGRELDSLARALPLASLFRTYAPRAPGALDSLPALVVWEQESHSFALQSAAIRPPEANSLIDAAMLRGNLIARGDFDRLPIPFRAVATDLRDRSPVVLAGGDLARAVRASLAIPLIFPPESIGASILADGGLSGCDRPNVAEIVLTAFDPAKSKIVVDYAAVVAGSDLSKNAGGAPGCMSGPTDPECEPIFERLGLSVKDASTHPDQQKLFTVE